MKTLKVKLSSYADCVLCISRKISKLYLEQIWGSQSTPIRQYSGKFFVNFPHGHDEHQVDLEHVEVVEVWLDVFCTDKGPAHAGQNWSEVPGGGVLEQPHSRQGPVDDDSQDENDNQADLMMRLRRKVNYKVARVTLKTFFSCDPADTTDTWQQLWIKSLWSF